MKIDIIYNNQQHEKLISEFMNREWQSSNIRNFSRQIESEEWSSPLNILGWDEKELIGVAKCKIVGQTVRVSQLLVKTEFRQIKGIGTRLLQEIEKLCISNRWHKIRLSTSVDHQNIDFYLKNGFQIEATLKNDAMGWDWYILSKFPLKK